jgi:hypothetical protein
MSELHDDLSYQLRSLFPDDSVSVSAENAMSRATRVDKSAAGRSRTLRARLQTRSRTFGLYRPVVWGLCLLLLVGVVVGVGLGSHHPSNRTTTPGTRTTTTRTTPTSSTSTSTSTAGNAGALEPGDAVDVSHLLAISFADDEHGFALAFESEQPGAPTIFATTSDGGTTWVDRGLAPQLPSNAQGILFASDTAGIIWTSGANFIERTGDAGRTWQRVNLAQTAVSASQSADTFMVVEASACFPTSESSATPCPTWIAWSSNAGSTWQQNPIGNSEDAAYGPAGVEGILGNAFNAYVIAGSHLYVSTNAGATWATRSQPCTTLGYPGYVYLSATEGADPSLWLACGGQPSAGNEEKAVYLSTNRGITWSLRSSALLTSNGDIPGNGYVGAIDAVSPTRAYMALGRLGVFVSSDGGRIWKLTSTVPAASAAGTGALDFVDATHGWALYFPLFLWRTTNGSTWTPIDQTIGG